MNVYRYKAVAKNGRTVDGIVEAYDEYEAVVLIKKDYQIVLKINEVDANAKKINLNESLWISEKVLSMVSSQFAILLKAGLPMVRTVTLVADQVTDKTMQRILKLVASDIAAGYGLAQSLATHGEKIPAVFIETVRAGEQAGTLELSFEKLAAYFSKSHKMKSKVKAALMYPAFLSSLAVVVIAIVMVFTVPTLEDTFKSFGNEMPLLTKMLIATARFMKDSWWIILAVLILLGIVIKLYGKTPSGKKQYATIAVKMPILGKISVMKGAAQFANTMATLLSAGLPITHALSATGKVIDNYNLANAVSAAVITIEEGKQLGEAIENIPNIPGLLKEMTAVGEESGALESTLTTIGEYYDEEVDAASQRALAMMEPAITVVMGIVIGGIVIAIYMPMFSMFG